MRDAHAPCRRRRSASKYSGAPSRILREPLRNTRRGGRGMTQTPPPATSLPHHKPLHALVSKAQRRKALEPNDRPFGVVSLDGKGFSIPSSDDWYAQRQTQGEDAALTGIVRTVTATLTSSAAKPIIQRTPQGR